MLWKKVAIVGVGLLGGSLGKALKRRRLARRVVGFVRRGASVKECEKAGAVHQATLDLREAVDQADLIVLCTPIGQMRSLVKGMLPAVLPGAIITDVGSVKQKVVQDLENLIARRGACFVGSHPMAGAEKVGVAAARADLFSGAACVVTPTRQTDRGALSKVEGLWRALGSRVLRLTPAMHDELVSRSSHLPHVVAAELSNLVLSAKLPKEQGMLCANGFRDTTRIALGSPEMWRDIALANRENLVSSLDDFIAGLHVFRRSLARKDARAVSNFFEGARERRSKWKARSARSSPE